VTDEVRSGSREPEEDEAPPPAGPGRILARFFLVPLLVVATAVGVFLVFNLLTFERRSPREYLQEVRGGGPNRRWQAAFELSRSIGAMPEGPEREALAAETIRIFETLSPTRPEDVPVRRYLTLVLGKLGDDRAVPALLVATKDPDPETRLYAIWALGMLADPGAYDAVMEASHSDDSGMRKMAAYVLGKLDDPRAAPRLEVLLDDRVPDVRWNAAIALAALGDPAGLPVLRSIVDRQALQRQATLSADQAEIAMVNALKAFSLLKDRDSLPLLEKVSREDPNLRVREAARQAIAVTRGAAPSSRLESVAELLVV
jgi:HEAT repeat protein